MIRTKNPIGFELLYARYYRLLFSTAYAVLRQESDAMDAVQNAALRLYTMDESLFPSDHELAWLHTVVKNEALMVLRKKKPEHSVDELPEIPVPERQLEMLEDMETVQSMLSSLDQKRQNVVTLKVLGGLSHKEIAQLLSMPVERSSGSTTPPSKACGKPSPLWSAWQSFLRLVFCTRQPVFPYTCPGAWRRFWHQQHPARRAVPVSLVYGVVDPADRFHCGRNSFFKFPTKFQQSEILAASK